MPIHGNLKLEITWTVIPLIIVLFIFGWSAKLFYTMARPPAGTLDVYVVGKQWMWKFQHPDGHAEVNELHVPVGTSVKLTMTSQDVIHDLYIPDFRVKADVLPGRYTHLWFKATKPGPVPPLLRGVLRDEPLRDGGLGRGPGARRVPEVARRRRRNGHDGADGREALQGPLLRHLPQGRYDRAAARRSSACTARP